MEFPLAARELTRAGRSKGTYAVRTAVTALMFLMLVTWWPFIARTGRGVEADAELVGWGLVNVTRYVQSVIVFALAPLFAAGMIAREKQDRSLDLLILADFRGADVFLSKLVTAFLHTELLLLSTLPVLAIAAFFGGISVPAVALRVFLLSVWAFAACAIGLLCSTLVKRPVVAGCCAIAFISAWCGRGLFASPVPGRSAPTWTLSIARAVWLVDQPGTPAFYWVPSVVVTVCIAATAVALGIALLPRQVYDSSRTPSGRKELQRPSERGRFPMSPAARLIRATGSGLAAALGSRRVRVLAAIGLALVAFRVSRTLGALLINALLLYDITASMASARAGGVFDDIRLTPVGERALGHAVLRAYLANAAIYVPAFFVSDFAPTIRFWLHGLFLGGASLGLPTALALRMLMPLASFVANFFCVLAIGCFAGTFRGKAVTQTASAVFILFCTGLLSGLLLKVVVTCFPALLGGNSTGLYFVPSFLCNGLLAYALYRGFLARCISGYLGLERAPVVAGQTAAAAERLTSV